MADLHKTTSFDEDLKADYAHHEVAPQGIPTPAILENLSEEERAVIAKSTTRKVDILIMPVMVTLYILNYLDRQNIASAKLAGLEADLGMTLVQYQTCVSVLFAGYIGFQVPSNMIISKIKYPSYFICAACALWGVVSACTAAVTGYASLAICRCVLGIVEAVFFPGAIYYLSCWYTKKQMGLRTAILYSGSQAGNAFGGLLAVGILELDGAAGIAGWRWLFLLEGVVTVAFAAVCVFILPNTFESCRWVTEKERAHLVHELEVDRGQKDNAGDVGVGKALLMACTDPKTWLSCGLLFFTYVAAAVTNFFPSVVKTLGFNRTITYCLTAPPYLICIVCILINGRWSDKRVNRFEHVVYPLLLTMVANIIAVSTLNTGARYFAMCLMPASFYSSAIVTLSWITGSASGPSVKRAVVLALINSICNTPNIWTSYLYKNPPRYLTAFSVNLAAAVVAILFACAFKLYLKRENGKLERGERTAASGPSQAQIDGGFRYPL